MFHQIRVNFENRLEIVFSKISKKNDVTCYILDDNQIS